MSESGMVVGSLAVVLVFLVRSGLLQLGIEWLQRRLGGQKPTPPPVEVAPKAPTLPELLAAHLAKVQAWEDDVAKQRQRDEQDRKAMLDALHGTPSENKQ